MDRTTVTHQDNFLSFPEGLNTPPRVDCYNCGVVRANIVPPHDGLMEPGLYCSVCDAGPLDETDDDYR